MQKPYQAAELETLLTHLLLGGPPGQDDGARERLACRCLEGGGQGFRAESAP